MAVTVKTLIAPKQAEATQTAQYTAVNCRTIIDKFTATNTSAANATISVNIIQSGGTTYFYNPAVGNIASINSATGVYTALSDEAKKKDFEPSDIGLDAILALQPKLFRMATDEDDAPKQLGFIAQEVKDHIPQAYVEEMSQDVSGEDATYIGLNDRPIIAALVKAVQELSARVAQLEGK